MLADFRGLASTVRPRDGEFLVGAIGNKDRFGFGVAFDANAIDGNRAREWKGLMEGLLDIDFGFDLEGKGEGRARL